MEDEGAVNRLMELYWALSLLGCYSCMKQRDVGIGPSAALRSVAWIRRNEAKNDSFLVTFAMTIEKLLV